MNRGLSARALPGFHDEDEAYVRAGLARDVLKKLRRGQWRVEEELDLHGMTAAEASVATERFLDECREHGLRCVRIVHGKGMRSPGREPVLKARVRALLAHRPEVLAFTHPPEAQGGSGAVVVLLEAAR